MQNGRMFFDSPASFAKRAVLTIGAVTMSLGSVYADDKGPNAGDLLRDVNKSSDAQVTSIPVMKYPDKLKPGQTIEQACKEVSDNYLNEWKNWSIGLISKGHGNLVGLREQDPKTAKQVCLEKLSEKQDTKTGTADHQFKSHVQENLDAARGGAKTPNMEEVYRAMPPGQAEAVQKALQQLKK